MAVPEQLDPSERRSLILQAVLCAVVFSAVLGVLTWCCAPLEVFRNRVVAALWGLLFGVPGGICFVGRMNGLLDDE